MKFTSLGQGGGYNLPACHMLKLSGFHILLDCPLDLSALTIFSPISCTSLYDEEEEMVDLISLEPYYKTVEGVQLWNVSLIDVVLISSPMGMLGLPFLTRTKGFSAKIYATEATTRLSEFMMKDLVAMHMEFKQRYGPHKNSFFEFFNWEKLESLPPSLKDILLGKDSTQLGSWMPLYSAGDVKECLQKVESVVYAQETCYNGSLIIKAFSSGLEIGACNWSLKSPKRNISYISRSIFTSGVAMDFDLHALIGTDVLIYSDFSNSENGSNQELEGDDDDDDLLLDCENERCEEMEKLKFICLCCMDSVKSGGSVLIPSGRLSIVLQLLELLALHLDSSDLKVPIFIISSVAEELLAYTCIIPEWLCKDRQDKMYSGKPVFDYEELIKEKKIHVFPTLDSRELLMMWQEPCIVICPHWSLRLGPAVHLLKRWHSDPNSLLVLEEGVDTDLALLPFKPLSMKVLECSFTSGIKLEKVPQLLKMLQPKQILVPDYAKPFLEPLSNSLPCLFYTESEPLCLPKSKNLCELHISSNVASKLKNKEMRMSRLKGQLYVEHGKHYLVEGKKAKGLEIGPLVHWGKVDLESLLVGLEKIGVKGSNECGSNVVNVVDPGKGLIELKETSVVISVGDESLALLISNLVHSLLNGI
ncbi:hypothetical protein LXL04_034336 [Taraxacum kok-saghyz]